MAFDPQGKFIATGCGDKKARIFSAETHALEAELEHGDPVRGQGGKRAQEPARQGVLERVGGQNPCTGLGGAMRPKNNARRIEGGPDRGSRAERAVQRSMWTDWTRSEARRSVR